MNRRIVSSIELEYRRYRDLGAGTLSQLRDEDLTIPGPGNNNSFCVLVRHISGNLRSRFTDFLTTDGEKPWRERDSEFATDALSRQQIDQLWNSGWDILFDAIGGLDDSHLSQTVRIRGQELSVIEALPRRADALPRQEPVGRALAAPEHPAGRLGRLQSGPDA